MFIDFVNNSKNNRKSNRKSKTKANKEKVHENLAFEQKINSGIETKKFFDVLKIINQTNNKEGKFFNFNKNYN